MKFETWPKVKTKIGGYSRVNGMRKPSVSEYVKSNIIHCPKCHAYLHFPSTGTEDYKGTYCFGCGRDLRLPFTRWEKVKHALKWLGGKQVMARWAIGYLVDADKEKSKEVKKK